MGGGCDMLMRTALMKTEVKYERDGILYEIDFSLKI